MEYRSTGSWNSLKMAGQGCYTFQKVVVLDTRVMVARVWTSGGKVLFSLLRLQSLYWVKSFLHGTGSVGVFGRILFRSSAYYSSLFTLLHRNFSLLHSVLFYFALLSSVLFCCTVFCSGPFHSWVGNEVEGKYRLWSSEKWSSVIPQQHRYIGNFLHDYTATELRIPHSTCLYRDNRSSQ